MSDDHAAQAISAYGSRVNRTPHLDRLAREGLRFDRAYATNSICTPSRATILTGKYSHKNGVPVFNAFDGTQPHVAKYLQAAGYQTAMIGKWHLGSDPTGFDHWEILPGQGRYNDPVLYDRHGARLYQGYVTDVITDLALAWLLQRDPSRPFLLMLHHKAPHRIWIPRDDHRRSFARRRIPEPPTLRDDYATRADAIREQKQSVFRDLTRRDLKLIPPPELTGAAAREWLVEKPSQVALAGPRGEPRILTGAALERWKYQRYLQDYLACVQAVDDGMGRVLAWLDDYGLRENTIVIYTSDQGFFLGEHGLYDKRFFYEESARMPLIVRWPAAIAAGGTTQALVINADFAPTLLAVAGVDTPADMQGVSLLPLLRGHRPADWRRAFYYRYYDDPGYHDTRAHYGVRTESEKLIYYWKKNQWEFFDLAKDPHELRNLYHAPAARPAVARLTAELARLRRELQDDDRFADALPAPGVGGPPRKWKPGFGPHYRGDED